MRQPTQINQWLSIEKMFQWLQNATDQHAYKRLMAIWLTHTGNLHANKVAEILAVSTQAVWLWIRQYNKYGPKGLERKGRGGRRWAFLTIQQEAELIKPFIRKALTGNPPKADVIKQAVEQKLGVKVSKPYIYRMLARNKFSQIIAQSRTAETTLKDDFRNLSRPWLRSV